MNLVKLDGNFYQTFMKQLYGNGYSRYRSDRRVFPSAGEINESLAEIPDDPGIVEGRKLECDVWLDEADCNGAPSVLQDEFFRGNLVYLETEGYYGKFWKWREPFYYHHGRCMKYIPDGPARLEAWPSEYIFGNEMLSIGKEARAHGFKARYAGDRAELYRKALKRLNGESPLPDGTRKTCEERIGYAKPMCKWVRKTIESEIIRLDKIDRAYKKRRNKWIAVGAGVAAGAFALYLYGRRGGGGDGDGSGKSGGGIFRTMGRGAKRLLGLERQSSILSDADHVTLLPTSSFIPNSTFMPVVVMPTPALTTSAAFMI